MSLPDIAVNSAYDQRVDSTRLIQDLALQENVFRVFFLRSAVFHVLYAYR